MKVSRVLLVVGVAFVCALVLILQTIRHGREQSSTLLPGGTQLELLACLPGGKEFTTDPPWTRIARRLLPNRFTGWLPQSVAGYCGGDTNTAVVYVRTTATTGALANEQPWSRYRAADDNGHNYAEESSYCTMGSTTNSRIYGLCLRSFPKRQKEFSFALLDPQGKVLASLRVPNPVSGPFPSWQGEPMPQARTNGPVTLTLQKIGRINTSEGIRYQPDWRVESSDPKWFQGRPYFWEYLDATGNSGPSLSETEPAWKLRPRLYRERFEDFGPEERLWLTNITVPAPGTFVQIDRSAMCRDVLVRVRGFAGPSKLYLTNNVHWHVEPTVGNVMSRSSSSSSGTSLDCWQYSEPFLIVEVNGASPHDRLKTRIVDQDGKEQPVRDLGWHGRGGGNIQVASFSIPANPALTNVSIAIHLSRPLEFEFTIDPRHIQ